MVFTRRKFIQTFFPVVACSASTLSYAKWFEPHWIDWNRVSMRLPDGTSLLKGRTLVHLSDLHIGPIVSEKYLLDAFSKVRSLQPDYVVMTGDFITFVEGFEEKLDRHLKLFPKGKQGTFAILGNHDYSHHFNRPDVAHTVTSIASNHYIKVLRNELTVVDGIQWVGLDDLWSKHYNFSKAFRDYTPRLPSIALAHNPDLIDHPHWPQEWHGWALSGHTHGGQCKLPFFPPPILPIKNRKYAAGKITLRPGKTLYVNRGLGHNVQLRFLVRPEITIFT
ncbi:MAG: metallophosphoesterase [Verrucomicrobiota bacterium]